ncbi:Asp23/Gls24 family envelope stress response protein [Actinokineospora pegani]|uniref:hypothetical protein n=1 Tax=Actinokineospora pegani TaxID=2654637 RepID=UPI0012EAF802|nr:hypothetical protein [Actinokineospora pegani]
MNGTSGTGGPAGARTGALPCGREWDDLVAVAVGGPAVDPGLSAHAEHCPYCAPALSEAAAEWSLVRAAAEIPVPPPPGLAGRALAAVRSARGAVGSVEVPQEGGVLRVSEQVVAFVAREAAREFLAATGGGRARSTTVRDGTVSFGLAVRFGVAAVEVAEGLRAHVRLALSAHLADRLPEVTVEVVDVVD